MDSWTAGRFEEVEEEVDVDFAGEEGAGGRVNEEDAVQEFEGADEEEVIGAGGGAGEKAFKSRYEADCNFGI